MFLKFLEDQKLRYMALDYCELLVTDKRSQGKIIAEQLREILSAKLMRMLYLFKS